MSIIMSLIAICGATILLVTLVLGLLLHYASKGYEKDMDEFARRRNK